VLGDLGGLLGVIFLSGTLCLCLVTREAFLGVDLSIWDTVFVLGNPVDPDGLGWV
jgi:hypothetical protein